MGYVQDKVVMVTGGGGSIGSELCRQIAKSHPKQLIIVDIYENDGTLHRFVKVDASKAEALVDAADTGDFSAVSDIAITDDDKAFLDKQTRIALRHCGVINPEDIEDYIGDDGYQGLKKVVCEMTPEEVIEEIKVSGLAGRGGAGFPTWFKWNAARNSKGDKKYLICNCLLYTSPSPRD